MKKKQELHEKSCSGHSTGVGILRVVSVDSRSPEVGTTLRAKQINQDQCSQHLKGCYSWGWVTFLEGPLVFGGFH
jgi:hypothetical protein